MAHEIFIGDMTYSSWSLRGWLLLHRFELPYQTRHVDFTQGSVADQMAPLRPAKTVPCLKTNDGALVWDSLAMAEELASLHPEAGIWPSDPVLRATARSLSAEMHCSYGALRNECPMHLRACYDSFSPSQDTLTDVARIEEVWAYALNQSGGPWLCGAYSAADVFFAPVAARFASYGLAQSQTAREYVAQTLADPAFRRWRAMAIAQNRDLPWYAKDLSQTHWPGPKALAAEPVDQGPSVNQTCPYSGDPVTDYLRFEGQVYGFCNPFCRDKTVADPEAWPAFMALSRG